MSIGVTHEERICFLRQNERMKIALRLLISLLFFTHIGTVFCHFRTLLGPGSISEISSKRCVIVPHTESLNRNAYNRVLILVPKCLQA